ncbi:MAG TPA: Rieske 2Fe-2S domain-containing protein [Candidatus Limnocylindrales bacterium]|nr:Rieske 2Fe-2S domain-containing protein [Candidatus Limnocylindrales bacterium]
MLSEERNRILTQVGRGTPFGELLRRYWYPVAFTADLEDFPVRKTRLLGQDLVVFRLEDGSFGLLDEQCPHRRASLAYGVAEPEGVRCGYHGWLFDREGRCLEQPAEPADSTFRDRIEIGAYPARELGGLVWGYLGPAPAPELPDYGIFGWDDVVRDAGWAMLPVNFFQIMENAVDPTHVEWLHGRYANFIRTRQGLPSALTFTRRHTKIAFDPFEHGIIKRRLYEGQSEEADDWKIGHPLVFPYMMFVGGGAHRQMQIRVPIDDTTTWFILYSTHKPDGAAIEPAARFPNYEVPWLDEHGRHRVDYVEGQDIMAWVTQGATPDRTQEHLGKGDTGVILLRKMTFENIDKVARGEDPLAVIRDPAAARAMDLPIERDKFGGGAAFEWEFLNAASTQFSPQIEYLREIYGEAQKAHEALAASIAPGGGER